jgi:transposase-like protein
MSRSPRAIPHSAKISYIDDYLRGESVESIAAGYGVSPGRVRRALTEASRQLVPKTRRREDLTFEVVRDAVAAAASLAEAARKLGTTTRTLRLRLKGGDCVGDENGGEE